MQLKSGNCSKRENLEKSGKTKIGNECPPCLSVSNIAWDPFQASKICFRCNLSLSNLYFLGRTPYYPFRNQYRPYDNHIPVLSTWCIRSQGNLESQGKLGNWKIVLESQGICTTGQGKFLKWIQK